LGGRLLLEVGNSEHLSDPDAERLLKAFSGISTYIDVEHTSPGPLYLFIWNLFAFWLGRGKSMAADFADLQPEDFWKRLENVVAEQAAKGGRNQDKLRVLALAGLLTFVLTGRTKRLAQGLRGKIYGLPWLIEEAEELTFVPAVLALKGLSLIDPFQVRFSFDRRQMLLAKAAKYDERGPAVDFICRWLQRDDRYHTPQR
jgi:hypothetical protein